MNTEDSQVERLGKERLVEVMYELSLKISVVLNYVDSPEIF